jgi:predicted enzyme related to lactoylglutathione lyase
MAKAKAKAKTKTKAKAKKLAPKQAVAKKPAAAKTSSTPPAGPVVRGLRTVIYKVDDLARAKTFYSTVTGRAPYFDQPFYVGYDVDGFELGLDPDLSARGPGAGGSCTYWRVDDIAASHGFLVALGAKSLSAPHNVGGTIQVAELADPFGNLVGLIQE